MLFNHTLYEHVKSIVFWSLLQKCCICRKISASKGKKTKDGLRANGATAGCAFKNCNKTFHYYCAAKNDTVITKRMLIRYKDQEKSVVMYRFVKIISKKDITLSLSL